MFDAEKQMQSLLIVTVQCYFVIKSLFKPQISLSSTLQCEFNSWRQYYFLLWTEELHPPLISRADSHTAAYGCSHHCLWCCKSLRNMVSVRVRSEQRGGQGQTLVHEFSASVILLSDRTISVDVSGGEDSWTFLRDLSLSAPVILN